MEAFYGVHANTPMTVYERLGKILGVHPPLLEHLDRTMASRTGRHGVLKNVMALNDAAIERALSALNVTERRSDVVRTALREATKRDEQALLAHLKTVAGETQFEKAANLARGIARTGKGLFLKKSFGADILRTSKPEHLLEFLGYVDVEEMLRHHDVTEIFSALRFIETDAWMHGTFDKAYSAFTARDFEERDIEIKVLGPEWHEVGRKFVAKKHHNVSHLKEFGVIFLNPISEDIPGKFVRDFALLLHYFHEIEFYSKLFRFYAPRPDFSTRLKSLLRGDVPQQIVVQDGEWLIVQRYLFKDNPRDPRLFLPRVNPESMHWFRGERDLADLGEKRPELGLELWRDLDWVGSLFDHGNEVVVSFDLEDNAMSEVSFLEGKTDYFNYHHREALWTRLFMEYAGGEAAMERLLVENFEKGTIIFE